MLKGKTIDRVCCAALAVMLALTGVVWAGKARAGRKNTVDMGYEGLFDQAQVHNIDIEMADWDSFIASATSEEYAECAVTIDGEKLANVGIRGKGNTSLSSVASMGSQKYSFKIEFDHFVKGRQYRGLDKLSLNNLIYDATLMKDYLAYTLMGRMDVPAPLCSYTFVTVNGEPWGLYLAVEGVEDGFLERNNMTTGELYKPDSMSFGGGRGNGRGFDFEQFRVDDGEESDGSENAQAAETPAPEGSGDFGASFGGSSGAPAQTDGFEPSGGSSGQSGSFQLPEGMTLPEGIELPEGVSLGDAPTADGENRGGFQMPGFGGGMFNFGMGNSDVKLQYIDDDPDSYSNIFDNAKTKVSKKAKARLIEALRKLSAREDIEHTVFTDEVIRYLAVHDFLQNDDSYTGMMVHNYYLYEENGQLAIIPWDYNLAFGGMTGSDASSAVNSPIDSPVSNGDASDRPLVAWIFEDEDALAAYHAAYDQFISDTVESGWLAAEISRVAELLRPYVEEDPNGFFTVEEFDAGVEAMQSYCALRGQSVRGQLAGTIPSTSAGQRGSDALVDASGLNISAMGAMNAGGGNDQGFGGRGNGRPSGSADESTATQDEAAPESEPTDAPAAPAGETPAAPTGDSSGMPAAPTGDMPTAPAGNAMPNPPAGGDMPAQPGGDGFSGAAQGSDDSFGGSAGGSSGGTADPSAQPSQELPSAQEATAEPAADQQESSPRPERPTQDQGASDTPAEPAADQQESSPRPERPTQDRGMRGGDFDFTPPGEQASGPSAQQWLTLGGCALLLLLAILLVVRVKGHNN